jgi:hypothetical protein
MDDHLGGGEANAWVMDHPDRTRFLIRQPVEDQRVRIIC